MESWSQPSLEMVCFRLNSNPVTASQWRHVLMPQMLCGPRHQTHFMQRCLGNVPTRSAMTHAGNRSTINELRNLERLLHDGFRQNTTVFHQTSGRWKLLFSVFFRTATLPLQQMEFTDATWLLILKQQSLWLKESLKSAKILCNSFWDSPLSSKFSPFLIYLKHFQMHYLFFWLI